MKELTQVEAELAKRWPESKLEPSLDRISTLVDLLGEPHRAYPVIHVAGTNGKTSTARMIEALLRAFGLKVGRYTSPHLESVTERISLDGRPLDPERFVAAYEDVAPYAELADNVSDVPLSYFEVITAMAYAAFADAPVDVAVVEVGMGGSWDATNVADGQVAVLTPIAIDHTDYLGESLGDIAAEKAGIIKPGALAVCAQQPLEVAEVLLRRAVDVEATVAREGLEFGVVDRAMAVGGQVLRLHGLGGQTYDEIFLPILGTHQAHNAACALAATEAFLGVEREPLDADLVRDGFAMADSPGRLEVVRRGPTIVLDAAHNPAGAAAAALGVEDSFAFTRLVVVIGVLADKDARGILEEFEPVAERIVATQSTSPRALPAEELGRLAADVCGGERVTVVPRLDDAIDAAVALAEAEGELAGAGVLVTGSIVTVGEARRLLGRQA